MIAAPRPQLPLWVFTLVGLCVLAQWHVAGRVELMFDEAYYWQWARHPALSYLDHPPMVAWFIRAGDVLLPNSELGVRLVGPLAIAATSLLLAGTVRALGGDVRAMCIAALLPQVTLIGAADAIIMTPDTPLMLFSALVLRLLAALVAGGGGWLWLAVGVAAGLALLSKYTAVMLGLGIVLWLLLVPARRATLATAWPWLGGMVAIAVFSPVLVWNAEHGWASFVKQGGRVAQAFTPSFKSFGDYLGAGIGLSTPLVAALIGYAVWALGREAWQERSDRAVLLLALSLPLSAYLLFYSVGHKTEANWALVVVPALFAGVALSVSEAWTRGAGHVRRLALVGLPLGGLMVAGAMVYLVSPVQHDLGRRDITQRMSGYTALSGALQDVLAQENGVSALVTTDYANTALLNFYCGRIARVCGLQAVQLNERVRYADFPRPAVSQMEHAVGFISQRMGGEEVLRAHFAQVQQIATLERKHRGHVVETYAVYRLSGFSGFRH